MTTVTQNYTGQDSCVNAQVHGQVISQATTNENKVSSKTKKSSAKDAKRSHKNLRKNLDKSYQKNGVDKADALSEIVKAFGELMDLIAQLNELSNKNTILNTQSDTALQKFMANMSKELMTNFDKMQKNQKKENSINEYMKYIEMGAGVAMMGIGAVLCATGSPEIGIGLMLGGALLFAQGSGMLNKVIDFLDKELTPALKPVLTDLFGKEFANNFPYHLLTEILVGVALSSVCVALAFAGPIGWGEGLMMAGQMMLSTGMVTDLTGMAMTGSDNPKDWNEKVYLVSGVITAVLGVAMIGTMVGAGIGKAIFAGGETATAVEEGSEEVGLASDALSQKDLPPGTENGDIEMDDISSVSEDENSQIAAARMEEDDVESSTNSGKSESKTEEIEENFQKEISKLKKILLKLGKKLKPETGFTKVASSAAFNLQRFSMAAEAYGSYKIATYQYETAGIIKENGVLQGMIQEIKEVLKLNSHKESANQSNGKQQNTIIKDASKDVYGAISANLTAIQSITQVA